MLNVVREAGFTSPDSSRFTGWRAFMIAAVLVWPHTLAAADFPDFPRGTDSQALSIASDKEAMVFFLNTFGPSLDLPKGLRPRRENQPALPDDLTQHLLGFMSSLSTWRLTRDLLTAFEQDETSTIQTILDRRQRQLEWLNPSQPDLPPVLTLAGAIAQLQPPDSVATKPLSARDAVFTQFLHEQYPDWTGAPDSWLALAQTQGATGVRTRLRDAWDRRDIWGRRPAQDGRHQPVFQDDPVPSINRFLRQVFLPTATAHVRAALLEIHVRNEQRAWTHWRAVRQWSDDQKNATGLRRLCGTWQWLIHNHQNHSDHKTVMVYPPPSQYHRMDPQPAMIRVRGDTVYIRWELPRGIVQEESLLLSEKDQLLSGTFVNNLGPNGSITGRRVKPCREIGG